MSKIRVYGYLSLAFAIFIIDRLTKYWALHYAPPLHTDNCFVQCSIAFNRGISWGMFNYESSFIFVSLCIIIAIVLFALSMYAYSRYIVNNSIFGPVLIFAGAFSNFIDRLYYHAIIDFIVISAFGYSFPVFNIADVSIVIGALLLFYESI